MPFLIFGNVDIWFARKELIWKIYTVSGALPTTKWVKHIKEFAATAIATIIKPL